MPIINKSKIVWFFVFIFILFVFLIYYLFNNRQKANAVKNAYNKRANQEISINNTPADYPIKISVNEFDTDAHAAYVVDINSMTPLFQKNIDNQLPLASITKLMTALVSIEHYSELQVLAVRVEDQVDGNKIGLITGERLLVSELLKALLVGSANEAAEVLANNFPEGKAGFVWAMNRKAEELGLSNTHFANPVGYDDLENYSSARDIAVLSIYAMKNSKIAGLVATGESMIVDVDGINQHQIVATNQLLKKDGTVLGVKTGWTEEAGECLTAYINRNNHPILTVILGSSDRFGETEKLASWIYENFQWKVIAPPYRL